MEGQALSLPCLWHSVDVVLLHIAYFLSIKQCRHSNLEVDRAYGLSDAQKLQNVMFLFHQATTCPPMLEVCNWPKTASNLSPEKFDHLLDSSLSYFHIEAFSLSNSSKVLDAYILWLRDNIRNHLLLQCPWQAWLINHCPLLGKDLMWPPNSSQTRVWFSYYQP